ncbi:MAG TPA: p-hydroxycinnamoyl CoA hydratase/lyase [Candidatus Binatia bacterium]|jgi:trans-feruloyl-CoA hydratase/vanillin synthase
MNKEYSCVRVETDEEGITWITFNRPEKRNAFNPTLLVEMEQITYELETDEATKVVVLTGAGNSWSAGMDLRQYFRETDKDPVARFRAMTAHRRWAELLTWSRKPTIAMVNGYCYGGAFISLAACDIVIAADTATFGLSEVNWGIIPGGSVSKVFGDMVSFRNALFYAMTGRTIAGRKAVEMGIATLSVPPEKLREETVTIARELIAKSPMVLAYTKQAIRAVRGMDMDQAYEYLGAKSMALRAVDPEQTRARGMREFLDEKKFRPGLGPVKRATEK